MLTNPVILSVAVMTILCLFKLNVILSLVVAALVAGVTSGLTIGDTMATLIGGMGGNAETALSYILLGALAAAIHKTGAAEILSIKIGQMIKGNKILLLLIIAFVAILSGTLIPVHIAFIPILIPPLLAVMNDMKLDRRAAATALGFGLKAPYIALPVGYGIIFHSIIKDSMGASGMEISLDMVWKVNWIAGLAMVVGFIISLLVFSKPREYKETAFTHKEEDITNGDVKAKERVVVTFAHYATILAGVSALGVQLIFKSLPLGAMVGLVILLVTKAIKWGEIDELLNEGIKMMGLIAFVMLVASGYASVIRSTGGVETLVNSATTLLGGSKLIGAIVMILLGVLITMGIGTSFGTIPIIAAIYVPMASALNFSVPATILLIAVAGALGDAGSPASDTTLGPTAGLNADGQHDHIWDTCVPQFLVYNIPLIVFGVIGSLLV